MRDARDARPGRAVDGPRVEATARRRGCELDALTKREEEVLALLAKGYAYKEIAGQMSISFETARSHARSIYEKLHVHCRTEAILKYLGQATR